jgi:hypothetical protein
VIISFESDLAHLVVDLQVYGLFWLDTDHQFIADVVQVGTHLVLVNVAWDLPVISYKYIGNSQRYES